ncbi:MAG: hypothetical protein ACLQU1_34690 [Bryobacteraceae bacterium]
MVRASSLLILALLTCVGCTETKSTETREVATDVPETVVQDESGDRIRVKYARVDFDYQVNVVVENMSGTPKVFDQCGLGLHDGDRFVSGVAFTWDNTQGSVATRLKVFNDAPVRGERGNVQVTIRPNTSYHVTAPVEGEFVSSRDKRIDFGCFITSENTTYVIGPFDEIRLVQ